MSKFLKFIVHFVVICTILCVVALAVPPFFGVTTEIRDDSTVKSNLAMGSVTYAIPVKTEEAALGTPILVNDENAVYRYTLASADVANGTGTAMDPTVSQGQPINVAIGSYLPKIVVTIPFIGYLMAATKSIEGLIVLGLTVLFLIILYVIAELWKKDQDDYDDYPEDTEPGYVKSRKELKKEEKRKEREYRDEEREIKAQGKRSKKEKRKIRTGGFVDEIDEDDFDVEEEEAPQRAVQSATSEAHELLKKEVAAATAKDSKPVRKSAKPATQTKKAALKKKAAPEIHEEEEDKPVEIKKLAIPRYSPAQLAAKAKKEGDAPDIVKDEITKVTLFDYSDIFADEDEDEDENSREARVYYVDDITGEIMGKTITVKTEYDIWKALQGNGILTEGCQLLSFKVNEETHLIDLDFNAATGEYIRSMGTTGEIQIIGCIINTYLETYDCDGIKLTEEGKVLQTSHGANYDGYSGIMSF